MAPTAETNSTLGTTTKTRRRRRRLTGAVRSGAGTGTGVTNVGPGVTMGIDHFGSYIRGAFEGFALANHIAPGQLLNGSKKYLTW